MKNKMTLSLQSLLPLLLALAAVWQPLTSALFTSCFVGCKCSADANRVVNCDNTHLSALPTIIDIRVTVRTEVLGLQRNRITELSTAEINSTFPRLRYLDVSEQMTGRPVHLIGPKLSATVEISGECICCCCRYFTYEH